MVPTKARPPTRTDGRTEARDEVRDAAPADYEQLRRHLGRPPIEHPAGRQRAAEAPAVPPHAAAAPGAPRRTTAAPESRLSVMDWLLAIGHVVVRRVRGVPRSPMIRLHPK